MKIEVSRLKVIQMKEWQLGEYLRSRGMDTSKEITKWENPARCYDYTFIGESLADKVVGCIKTVIGLVPITEPWEAAG